MPVALMNHLERSDPLVVPELLSFENRWLQPVLENGLDGLVERNLVDLRESRTVTAEDGSAGPRCHPRSTDHAPFCPTGGGPAADGVAAQTEVSVHEPGYRTATAGPAGRSWSRTPAASRFANTWCCGRTAKSWLAASAGRWRYGQMQDGGPASSHTHGRVQPARLTSCGSKQPARAGGSRRGRPLTAGKDMVVLSPHSLSGSRPPALLTSPRSSSRQQSRTLRA